MSQHQSTIDPSKNQDGTLTRHMQFQNTQATQDLDTTLVNVLSKDVPLNPINSNWLRIFLPRTALSNQRKLPLIVYYHGGGFVYLSASSTINHDFCFKLAEKLPAVIASVDYRLAPASRLPAAYDDAVEALHWLRVTDEKWVCEFGDVSNCYLMGSSAGGNMAYHAGLRASVGKFDPLKIRGLILHQPFFGGSQRTESELRLINDPVLPLRSCDQMWELALPEGANRDHKYCNPTVVEEGDDICFDEIKRLRWKILVTGCYGDPLIDRQVRLVEMLRSRGVDVVGHFGEGFHGIELLDPSKDEPLFVRVKDFIHQC
ncbi:carboxylesterase 1-like [Gastrolobium bilobum]|uniref:carboxylesterase 1-like n=1 Tax=Gastrolobium bilobum TaxID=150636 RepID=UPI002AB21087|nr:carboxylesterase 1-like [Gastrolobium bilobum]